MFDSYVLYGSFELELYTKKKGEKKNWKRECLCVFGGGIR